MKRILLLTVISLSYFSVFGQDRYPNLIIGSNEIRTLPPRTYSFDTIHVKTNGKLKFSDNSNKWAILNANVFILEGSIEYINFSRNAGTVTSILESGKSIEYKFPEKSFGGVGGNGSGNGIQMGGYGFVSNSGDGGGGGSGAQQSSLTNSSSAGINAVSYKGAPSGLGSAGSFGGDGGRSTNNNGGLLYIKTKIFQVGTAGSINLSGSNGVNGKSGGGGSCYRTYRNAGGGGGGGSAGGDGGVLIADFLEINNYPRVNVNPGRGGKGGSGGKASNCSYDGTDGAEGDIGTEGYVDWN
ncbi:hypothetical protein [Flavobacterium lindanitolerans]|jgi:hypothetical protein|uniref:hypothetical protein n=1 Tax=Flavobacterium lindanitolerans TaxID=428988 RepID=UPI0027B908E0|nr:hypothetical protein [Flavobacterium lindanitolerans]